MQIIVILSLFLSLINAMYCLFCYAEEKKRGAIWFLWGKDMGRARKPFMEKSTNIFLAFKNVEIVELLKKFKIDYEVPEEVWDDETKAMLTKKIKEKLLS